MSINNEEKGLQSEKQQLSRRDFIKASGVTAGIAGVAAVGSATPALAGEKDKGSAIMNLAVKDVDRPPYMDYPYEINESKIERFHHGNTTFRNVDFAKKHTDGKAWFIPYSATRAQKVVDNVPGWTLLDQSLAAASELSDSVGKKLLMSWSPLGGTDVKLAERVGKIYTNPDDNNRYIKKAAHVFGAGDCGIAELNEKWFYASEAKYVFGKGGTYTNKDIPIIFSDEHDVPTVTDEAKYIPKKMNRVIAIIIPMEGEIAKYTPSRLGSVTDNMAYSQKVEIPSKLAEFIRGLGYNAIPMGNDTSLCIPIAIDAGLGELGRHGLLIHPKYGTLCKITKVLTDMPITPDKPINFGAAEFCRTCMKCADNCPSSSISKETDPFYEPASPSNIKGVKKWHLNAWTCLDFWINNNGGGCMVCMTVCPYAKPQTWIHDIVKGVSSKTTLFNSTFRFLDDVLGYGKTLEANNPLEWWEKEEHGIEWLNI